VKSLPALVAALTVAAAAAVCATAPAQQAPATPTPAFPSQPVVSPFPTATPAPLIVAPPAQTELPSGVPSGVPSGAASAAPTVAPSPTPPPVTVSPEAASVAVGSTVRLQVGSALGTIAAVAKDPTLVDVGVDQRSQSITLAGKAPGATVLTVSDSRGLSRDVPVRVAFYAGSVAPHIKIDITGDPASPDFIKEEVARSVRNAAQARAGAQIVVGPDDVPFSGTLARDRIASFDVPVLIQGTQYFEVDASTHVEVENVAVPRISPDSLMVSDYPERLEENGLLFTTDLQYEQPSRFLYFHYNPPGQPDRRIVLRAENQSNEPALVQFISGRGGPSPNEMEVGHAATKAFLVDIVQNQGRLIEIPAKTGINLTEQDMPAGDIVCNLLQLRILSGANVHLTLFAQDAGDNPYVAVANSELLQSTHKHARGIYSIPEFHYATQWNVNGDYLEVPIGQIPLPNSMQGETLAGDYGVLQSFVVTLLNPMPSPQQVAIYENPRGGRSTGTYLIDGVLVQSHQVPPFSRYKIRQYVVPARGFVRVTIVTMPEAGSSYPLRLIFAPDDGSVAPGGPGSPAY